MRRFPLSFRSQVYNEADFYKLTPLVRKAVAPGDTISTLVVDARFISAVFPKVVTTPLLAQMWAFYVPNRLVWDQWIDFIALSDTVTTVPSTTTAWPQLFEHGTATKHSLYRRGYKRIYNEYYGDETAGQAGEAWYDDPNLDSYVTLHRLLAWDQFVSNRTTKGSYSSSVFSATVSGGTAAIPLDDFARALRNNTARRRQRSTGDKYVDTMRMMGVELDWRVQMAPEFLGSSQAVLIPRERAGSGDSTSLSSRVSEWSGKLSFVSKRRLAFAEHGMLHVLVGFRPAMMPADFNSYENASVAQTEYYRPDADTVAEVSGAFIRPRYSHYHLGSNVVGINHNGNAFVLPSAQVYPDPSLYSVASTSGPRHMAATADVSIRGLTPVPSSRA